MSHAERSRAQRHDAPASFVPGAALAGRIADRTARVAVIGLGYAGLPMALAMAAAGFATTGIDTDEARVARLLAGESGMRHVGPRPLRTALRNGRFTASTEPQGLTAADAILICVPTPLGPDRQPDLSAVEAAARSVARHLRPGTLVVLESTTWPGTTREVVLPILEAGGLRCGLDVFLAYSPEREDPGNTRFRTAGIPRVVGGADPESLRLALALYGAVVRRTVPVASLEAAEAVKLTENAFRAVNIALANELKLAYAAMGIDVWEVVEAAATKPFGYMPFWPGPGVGGHCIPIDPLYLAWRARRAGVPARFVELAGEINADMPFHVLTALERALRTRLGRGIRGSRILVLGAAYKPGIEDVRESPALRLIELIEGQGGVAPYHDPLVPRLPALPEHPGLADRHSLPWAEALCCDAALIVTDQPGLDYAGLCAALPLVVDTRNACARRSLHGPGIVAA